MKSSDRWIAAGCAAGMSILILDGKTALEGARIGMEMCIRSVIPSLFPFFVFSNLLNGILYGNSIKLLQAIGCIFGMPHGAESILIPAFLGGYPIGAQSIGRCNRLGKLSYATCSRLLCFCNNVGPAFLFGIVGKIFHDRCTVWLCWGIQVLCPLIIALFLKSGKEETNLSNSFSVTLPQVITDSIRAMSNVCSWIILFRIFIAFLQRWFIFWLPVEVTVFFCGLLELSNGCFMLNQIESECLRFILANIMLSFGGLCVIMQTNSVIGNLPIKPYLISKIIQAVLAAIISIAVSCSFLWIIPICGLIIIYYQFEYKNKGSIPSFSGV